MLKGNKLYIFLLVASAIGYIWLFYSLRTGPGNDEGFNGCFIKQITGFPCPSCGSTRSVLLLSEGRLKEALFTNPLGIVIASGLMLIPLWSIFDLTIGKRTLLSSFKKAEKVLRKRWVAIPLILLILANWIWNIIKGL